MLNGESRLKPKHDTNRHLSTLTLEQRELIASRACPNCKNKLGANDILTQLREPRLPNESATKQLCKHCEIELVMTNPRQWMGLLALLCMPLLLQFIIRGLPYNVYGIIAGISLLVLYILLLFYIRSGVTYKTKDESEHG